MSFSGPDDVKDRIRQMIDIVELIGEQIPLRRQGRAFVGLCPWHNDTRPSLQVDPERQTFTCWVCDVRGDCFEFVKRREGVDFAEAKRMLAERAGLPLASTTPQRRTQPGSPDDKNTLLQVMAWAVEQFHGCLLHSPKAQIAREYLQRRQIDAASIQRYQIGFSPPEWDWLLTQSRGSSYSRDVLKAAGLVKVNESTSRVYDAFRGRVLFPICDARGKPIALGGRRLDELSDEQTAKYLNSPETMLFSKSQQLYGLHLAKDAVNRNRHALLMEGYTDVVIARQCGIENVVAILGTALVEGHIRLIRRFADRVTLVLDGDTAGRKRANEVLDIFLANQLDLRIVTLPNHLDPCDFLLTQGAAAMQALVEQAPDALEHKIAVETQDLDLIRDTHQTHRALENLLATLARAPAARFGTSSERVIWEQQVLNRLSRLFRVSEEQLRTRLRELRQQTRPAARSPDKLAAETPTEVRLEAIEYELFELVLQLPEAVPRVLEAIREDQLRSPAGRALLQGLARLAAAGRNPDFHELMREFDDPGMQNLLLELDTAGASKSGSDSELALQDLLRTFSRQHIDARLQECLAALDAGNLNDLEQLVLLQQIMDLRRQLES